MAQGGTCQDTEGMRPSKGYSLSGDGGGGDLLEHGKYATEQGRHTNLRRPRGGLVRTRKERDGATRTHFLETAEGGTCRDTERMRRSEGHSLPGDGKGRDLSGGGKRRPSDVHPLPGDGRERYLSGNGNNAIDRGTLTFWTRQRESLVRTLKKATEQRALTSWRR